MISKILASSSSALSKLSLGIACMKEYGFKNSHVIGNKDSQSCVTYPLNKHLESSNKNPYTQTQKNINSLYVHIPFCTGICNYCSYVVKATHEGSSKIDEYIDYISAEFDILAKTIGLPICVESVYIGGGTPTILSNTQLSRLLSTINSHVLCSGEYTLEGSPETVTSEKIKTAKEHGVNRVSIGVESWDDSVLTAINRRHTAAVAEQAIHNIRLAGITDIDIDLIRGLPGQTRESLARDVQICAELDIPSITCYQYSLKPRSVDAKVISSTGYEFSDDDLIELGVIVDTGFSLAGYQAGYPAGWYTKNVSYKHNIIKWQEQANQIAIGVSSYGYWEGTSFSNTSSIKEYYKLIDDGVLPITKASDLTVTEIARRHFMFALKTVADVKKLNDKYNFDIISTLGLTEKINMLLEAGAISVNDGRITLTPLGRLFADQIIMSMYNETFKDT